MNGAAKGWSVPFVFYIHCTVSSSRPPGHFNHVPPKLTLLQYELKSNYFFLNLDNNIV